MLVAIEWRSPLVRRTYHDGIIRKRPPVAVARWRSGKCGRGKSTIIGSIVWSVPQWRLLWWGSRCLLWRNVLPHDLSQSACRKCGGGSGWRRRDVVRKHSCPALNGVGSTKRLDGAICRGAFPRLPRRDCLPHLLLLRSSGFGRQREERSNYHSTSGVIAGPVRRCFSALLTLSY